MALGGEYRLAGHRRSTWPMVATELGLDADRVVTRVRELAARAPGAFSEAGEAPDVAALGRPLTPRLVDLVAERARACLATIG